jgi:ATP-dependent exoDNAse (exonuclease V) alpha subunit
MGLREKTTKGLFWVGLDNLLVGTLKFGSQIVLARILAPQDFGIVSIGLLVINTLGLFNGDIGITLNDGSGKGELKVFFPGDTEGAMRSFIPRRLPAHETVFAMTVHKAQGSEFDHILLILPPLFVPLLSRELLYTGITRAQKSCEIWASREILMKAIENRIKRISGLREKIWG